jgi:hypothetical protein
MSAGDNIVVACPKCTQKYRVPEKGIGRRVACKKCGQPFRVAVDAPIDEDTLFGWVMEDDPASSSIMGSTSILGSGDVVPPRPVTPARARVELVGVDADGARFSFESDQMFDAHFRRSFPQQCAKCLTREHLNVQNVVWNDDTTMLDLEARTVRSLSYLRRRYSEHWIEHLDAVANLPKPLNRPFPYYVCTDCRPARGVIGVFDPAKTSTACALVVANLSLAVGFFRNNGGRRSKAYQKLLVASRRQRDSQWHSLAVNVRARITQWFCLRDGERFLGYYADADSKGKASGKTGVVLTDRRIVCQTHGLHREFYLQSGGMLRIDADHDAATIAIQQGRDPGTSITTTPLTAGSLAQSLKALDYPWSVQAHVTRKPR